MQELTTLVWKAVTFAGLALLCGCERQYEKQDFLLEGSGPPLFNVTDEWTGSWNDPVRGTSEMFKMVLLQEGTNVTGKASFMDANGTQAEVSGQASGLKLRILMSPHPTAPYRTIPETTWLGTFSNNTISGTWYLHGKPYRGYASTGPWSASLSNKSGTNPQPSE